MAAKTTATATAAVNPLADPDYFTREKLKLDAKKIEMDATAAYKFALQQAAMELDFAKKVAGLKLMESRAKRVSR